MSVLQRENLSHQNRPTRVPDAEETIEKYVNELEKKRKSTVIPLLFTDETELDRGTVTDIYDYLEFTKKIGTVKQLDIILHSSGGILDAAIHLTEILRSYSRNLNFIVPRYAKSAATLVALSGDGIFMDKPSELGPLGPVWIGEEGEYEPSALPHTIEFLRDLEKKLPKDSKTIEIIAKRLSIERMGVYKASLEDSVEPLTELLCTRMFKKTPNRESVAGKIAKKLVTGYSEHGYPVTIGEVTELGIPAKRLPNDEWQLVWKIFKTFDSKYERFESIV